MMKDGGSFTLIAFSVTELFNFWVMQIRGLVTSLDWHKILQNHKKWNVSEEVLCIELKPCAVITLITLIPWLVLCDICMTTQWAPGPRHPKGKVRVPLFQELLFAFDFHSESAKRIWSFTQHMHKKVCQPLEQQIRHYSFWEGRGLVMSMLPWWHHNHYHKV